MGQFSGAVPHPDDLRAAEVLPWIKQSKLENPSGTLGVLGRMALEVFFFRSLFRNLKIAEA